MYKQLLPFLLTAFMIMVGAKALAHDIEMANADGVTIYYVWANDAKTELAVSYRGVVYNDYSGNVIVPKIVEYEGKTYAVTSIGESAFSGCSGLTSITIPNSVTSIGGYAFSGCSGLTSIMIPNSVTSIGGSAFKGCKGLTSITIPNSVTSIGERTFYNCRGLTSITIPNSVTSIGEWAFYDCSGLTSVIIPNSVTNIGSYAFYDCNSLTSVIISDLSSWLNIVFGDNSANPLNSAHHLFINGEEITNLTIPNDLVSIGNYVFQVVVV